MNEVCLTQKEFDDLLEYSMSLPTGTTIGKQWKRHNFIFKNKHGIEFNTYYLPDGTTLVEERWLMGEYVKKKGYVDILWSLIEIVPPIIGQVREVISEALKETE